MFGLAGLLGLAGGASELGAGLSRFAEKKGADDERKQATALQLMLAGYQPTRTTPTATDHPLSAGMLAHTPTLAGMPQTPNAIQSAFDPSGLTDEMGGAPTATPQFSTTPAIASTTPTQQIGSSLATLMAPKTLDVPGLGQYQESPQAFAARQMAMQTQQAALAHTVAETRSATALAEQREVPKVPKNPADVTGSAEWKAAEQFKAGLSKPKFHNFIAPDGSKHFVTEEEAAKNGWLEENSQGGFGFGQGGPQGAGRALSAIGGLNDANEKMKRFEVKVASKQANLSDLDYFRGELAKGYGDAQGETGLLGHVVPFFGTAAGATVLARLNRTNPELANYLQAASQWALEESTLSNRPSDYRTKMDEFVSALKPDAQVQSIHDLWSSRQVRLQGYQQAAPALQSLLHRATAMSGSTAPTPPPGGPASGDPAFDALLAKYRKP